MMSKKNLITLIILLITNISWAQIIENVELKSLENETIYTDSILSNSKYSIVIMWASYSPPSVKSLTQITELFNEKDFESKFKTQLIALNIDKTPKDVARAKSIISNPRYPFLKLEHIGFYFDIKSEFLKQTPDSEYGIAPTMILLFNNEVIQIQRGYSDGDEKEILQSFKKAIRKNN